MVGVLLVATTAGGVFSDGAPGVAFGALRRFGLLPAALAVAQAVAPLADLLPWRGCAVGRWLVRYFLFGADPDPTEVRAAQDRADAAPLPVDAPFYASLLAHDQTDALLALARVPVVVFGGARDRITPVSHSDRISTAVARAPSSSSPPTPATCSPPTTNISSTPPSTGSSTASGPPSPDRTPNPSAPLAAGRRGRWPHSARSPRAHRQ